MLPYAEEQMPLKWMFEHSILDQTNEMKVNASAAQSPVLNLIENLWVDIKNAFEAKTRNAEEL